MKERFSDRIGKTKPSEALRIDGMSEDLKNSTWNFLYKLFVDREKSILVEFTTTVCSGFFKIPLNELPTWDLYDLREWIRDKYFRLNWYEIYNLLEFISEDIEFKHRDVNTFQNILNGIFQSENSGYRFIEGILSPISNEEEIKSIEYSILNAESNLLYGTAKHFRTALELFSKRPNPDFRNSIKESISAVESIVKQVTGEKGGGLDKALNVLDDAVKFHPAFKQGLLKLYGYTSDDKGGIRHAILEEKEIGFDEAKYMLVSCSAFVNFIIAKAEKVGLLNTK